MKPTFQSKQSVVIEAPLQKVWEFNMDLSKIAEYHPRVHRVDLISGKQFREAGAAYQCHLSDGKNTCVEKDVEVVPMDKIVTILPSDTMGLTKLLPDYVVETTFRKVAENKTEMTIAHYYSSDSLKIRLLNFIIRPKIARETKATLKALKDAVEQEGA